MSREWQVYLLFFCGSRGWFSSNIWKKQGNSPHGSMDLKISEMSTKMNY